VLTLLAGQAESLWDETLPIEVKELPEDLAALDGFLCDPGLLAPIVEHWRREVADTGRLVLTEGRPTIAMETFVRLMVTQDALPVGISGSGRGGLGLDSSAAVLPHRVVRAGPGRVDGPQADAADWGGNRERSDACADHQGGQGEALPGAGGPDRLDGDRGRHQVPDGCGPRVGWGAVACAGSQETRQQDHVPMFLTGRDGAAAPRSGLDSRWTRRQDRPVITRGDRLVAFHRKASVSAPGAQNARSGRRRSTPRSWRCARREAGERRIWS